MKNTLGLLLLFAFSFESVAAYTEFYAQTTGSNLNAGSTTNNSAFATYSGTFVRSTGVFTVASGNPITDGVSIGSWASVYTTAGATNAGLVASVTATNSSSITVSLSAISGSTNNVSETANAATLKIGGAWAGPSGANAFPIGFAKGSMTNSSGNSPRINFLSGVYSITNGMTDSLNDGPVEYSGYTNSPGDGGFATIDGGTSGASYTLLTLSGKNRDFYCFVFRNNGATGNADGIVFNGIENSLERCVIRDIRGNGVLNSGVNHFYECEAFNCNLANTSGKAAFNLLASGTMANFCIAHHNTNSNASGFQLDGGINVVGCIAATNGASGIRATADVTQTINGCSFYQNGGSGIDFGGSAGTIANPMLVNVINCLFVGNAGAGIRLSGTGARYLSGRIRNCAFGSGSRTNQLGNFVSNVTGASQNGSTFDGVTVAGVIQLSSGVSPWADANNGDFRITSSEVKSAGYGFYLQTYTNSNWSGTVGYQDVGAAQHNDGSASGGFSFPFLGP